MSRLQVAILGAGMIGTVHRRAALLADADVVGVMDSTPQRSREAAAKWGVPTAFSEIEQVAQSDVDVVHICTPNSSHVPYAVELMRAGKHVVCEKPLGGNVTEATHAAQVAGETGVVNTVPFVYRFHPMVREMRARVAASGFGAVNLVHGSYLQDWMLDPRVTSWRVDPGQGGASRAFADIGSHWCDLAEWVTGDRIETLVATTSISIPRRPVSTGASFTGAAGGDAELVDVRTEDSALILFRTRRGIAGSATISQVSSGRKNRLWLEIDGANASAVFDQEDPEHLWIGSPGGAQVLNRDPQHGAPDQRRLSHLPAGHAQGYAQCFENFIADTYAAIRGRRDGTTAPDGLPTFADGLRAAAICDAMLESARTRSWMTVNPAYTTADSTSELEEAR